MHFTIFLLVFLARHTPHKSAKPKSANKPTAYPTKYLRQYSADEDVSSYHPLPMYVGMLAVWCCNGFELEMAVRYQTFMCCGVCSGVAECALSENGRTVDPQDDVG